MGFLNNFRSSISSHINGGVNLAKNAWKFGKKNPGEAIGHISNIVGIAVPGVHAALTSLGSLAGKGSEYFLGKDSELTKQINNFTETLRGNTIKDEPKDGEKLDQSLYNPNAGGTNFMAKANLYLKRIRVLDDSPWISAITNHMARF